MKQLRPSEIRTFMNGVDPTEVIVWDELSDPMTNQQSSKSRIRQHLNIFLDKASAKKEKLLIVRGN
jgi:hypothetical protein